MFNNKNKYGSRKKKDKPMLDGYVFDSLPEYERYIFLKDLEKKRLISGLEVHPKFILARGIKNDHKQHIYQWSYEADFKYLDASNGSLTIEDVKSLRIDKSGKKHGTATKRDYKLTRNELMRQNPHILFREIT